MGLSDASVKAPPSSIVVTAVVVAAAGLVLTAVILVVVARSGRHVSVQEIVPLSSDACNVVTADMATTVFNGPAGPPHFVLGECVYDNGTDELIVEVFRQNARSLYDTGHSALATDVPDLGDGAYFIDGRLRVLKGTSLLSIALGPTPPATLPPKLLALANTAVGRL